MPGKATPVGTLTSEEVAQLRLIEGELQRLAMTHAAMLSMREAAMVNLVRSRGFDPTVEDYTLDLDHALILQLEKAEEKVELQAVPDEPAAAVS